LNDANAFGYLAELQKYADKVAKNPSPWMPWNNRKALVQAGAGYPSGQPIFRP